MIILQTKKVKLKTIIRNNDSFKIKINDIIDRTNLLTTYVYQLLRLWILHKFQKNNKPLKPLTITTIKYAFRVFIDAYKIDNPEKYKTIKDNDYRPEYNELYELYTNHFRGLVDIKSISGRNLSHIIDDQCTDMLKNIENNIRMHFNDYLRQFVNVSFKKYNEKQLINLTGKEKTKFNNQLRKNLNVLKSDLINNKNEILSEGIYLQWFNKYKPIILPTIKPNRSHVINISTEPYNYLYYMYVMNKELEKENLKMFQLFPLRTNCIKKYIPIDTSVLIDLFMENKNTYFKDINKYKYQVWNTIFKMKQLVFKSNNYKFDYRIMTNGYSCSLQFMHNDYIEKDQQRKKNLINASKKSRDLKKNNNEEYERYILEKKALKQTQKEETDKKKQEYMDAFNKLTPQQKAKIKEEQKIKRDMDFEKNNKVEFPYIDDLPKYMMDNIKNKKKHKIYIDPGKRDIFKMLGDNGKYFTYSSRERQHEMGQKKYRAKILKYKKENKIIELETELGKYNSKTINFDKFKEYIRNYTVIIKQIKSKYKNDILEKLKWYTYINKTRSEDKLLNKIENTYGKDSVIIIGDWSISKQMRNFISTPMISIKRVLKRRFKVYNIDESYTSIIHHTTENKCKNLYLADKNENLKKMHSILTYRMENKRLGCINRDINSVNNIKKIAYSILNGYGRPIRYTQKYNMIKFKTKNLNPIDMNKIIRECKNDIRKSGLEHELCSHKWRQFCVESCIDHFKDSQKIIPIE